MLRIQRYTLQVMPYAQPHQVIAGKLLTGQTIAITFVDLPGPGQVLVGNPFIGKVPIGLFAGQDELPWDTAARYAVRHFSGFEFFLLPGRVHARPHAGNVKPLKLSKKFLFQNLVVEKWVRNIEERPVFCVPNHILAIFEPAVGDFLNIFHTKVFSPVSLGGSLRNRQIILDTLFALC